MDRTCSRDIAYEQVSCNPSFDRTIQFRLRSRSVPHIIPSQHCSPPTDSDQTFLELHTIDTHRVLLPQLLVQPGAHNLPLDRGRSGEVGLSALASVVSDGCFERKQDELVFLLVDCEGIPEEWRERDEPEMK
jgi:hypothetical protein